MEKKISDMHLIIMAESGNKEELKRLLDAGADPNATDSDGASALLCTVYNREEECAEMLLTAGAAINVYGPRRITLSYCGTPLCAAVSRFVPKTAQLLIDHGADVNMAGEDGVTPLMAAAAVQFGQRMTAMLLKAGADPNTQDSNGKTAFYYAVCCGNLHMAKKLLKAGADPYIIDNYGKTAVDLIAAFPRQKSDKWHWELMHLLPEGRKLKDEDTKETPETGFEFDI